jgi:uncharacterized membrane protein YozB (DUF420 family)
MGLAIKLHENQGVVMNYQNDNLSGTKMRWCTAGYGEEFILHRNMAEVCSIYVLVQVICLWPAAWSRHQSIFRATGPIGRSHANVGYVVGKGNDSTKYRNTIGK